MIHQRESVFATQRSDTWSPWELPYVDLDDEDQPRVISRKIRSALRRTDLERRVKNAERELKESQKLLEKEMITH